MIKNKLSKTQKIILSLFVISVPLSYIILPDEWKPLSIIIGLGVLFGLLLATDRLLDFIAFLFISFIILVTGYALYESAVVLWDSIENDYLKIIALVFWGLCILAIIMVIIKFITEADSSPPDDHGQDSSGGWHA